MYFTPYLNTYVSRSQAYSYRIVENFLHCDSLNRFESTQIELLTNDTLQLKVNESVICFSKVDQYKQAESVELLKNKLKHNWILLNNREYFLKFHDIGYGLYGIKDINGNVNEGIMKIFKDGSELFISFSGSNSELLQVKSISSKTIECVNHIPIPSSYKIKLVEH